MTTYKFNGNKRLQSDFAEIFGEYGRCTGRIRIGTAGKAGRMGSEPKPDQRADRQATQPSTNSEGIEK